MTIRTSPSRGPGSPDVTGFHDADTGSVQYVAACPATGRAALIDAVQALDPAAARTSMAPAEALLEHVEREGLTVAWVLDTHPHADHLMASAWLAERTAAPTAIGARTREIASLWRGLYHLPGLDPEPHFDRLVEDGETLALGDLAIRVALSPGHTLGSVSYLVGDAAFVHDTFMHPDAGTARCDFPGGSAEALWRSLQAILALPEGTRLFVGHDYGAEGRTEPAWESTVAQQREGNVHPIADREAFVARREARDATLPLPSRMLMALQVNLRGGRAPEPEADGRRYLKIPLDRF